MFFSSVSQNTSHILHLKQKIQGSLRLAMVQIKPEISAVSPVKLISCFIKPNVSLVTSQRSCSSSNDFISHQAASKLCVCYGNMKLPQSFQERRRNWKAVQELVMPQPKSDMLRTQGQN